MTESEWIERIRKRVHRFGDDRLLQGDDIFAFIEEALTQYPLSARLWNARGDLIQMSDGESYSLQDALASYQRAAELKPDDPEAYESIGYYCDAVDGRIADAEPAFRKAVELGARVIVGWPSARTRRIGAQGRGARASHCLLMPLRT